MSFYVGNQNNYNSINGAVGTNVQMKGQGNCGTCNCACKCDISRPTCTCFGGCRKAVESNVSLIDFFSFE